MNSSIYLVHPFSKKLFKYILIYIDGKEGKEEAIHLCKITSHENYRLFLRKMQVGKLAFRDSCKALQS